MIKSLFGWGTVIMRKGSSYVKILDDKVNQYVEQRAGEMGKGPQAVG